MQIRIKKLRDGARLPHRGSEYNMLSQLRIAVLTIVARGTGGIIVNLPLDEITFFDAYH